MSNMQGIRTITLDLDDTLWEIRPVIQRAEKALRHWLKLNVPEVAARVSRESVNEIRGDVISEYAHMLHDLTFIRHKVLARMGHAAGVGDHFVEDAFNAFDQARNTLELFPEAEAALESMAKRYTLIAVTNGNAKLDRIGIDHLFEDCVSARFVGSAKPHRAMFDAAVEAGGAAPESTLHVGDHPEHDVHGAREAGMPTVWVNRFERDWPQDIARPDITVTDLAQLDRLLIEAEQE